MPRNICEIPEMRGNCNRERLCFSSSTTHQQEPGCYPNSLPCIPHTHINAPCLPELQVLFSSQLAQLQLVSNAAAWGSSASGTGWAHTYHAATQYQSISKTHNTGKNIVSGICTSYSNCTEVMFPIGFWRQCHEYITQQNLQYPLMASTGSYSKLFFHRVVSSHCFLTLPQWDK